MKKKQLWLKNIDLIVKIILKVLFCYYYLGQGGSVVIRVCLFIS